MDSLQFRYEKSIPKLLFKNKDSFWNPSISWKNKHKYKNKIVRNMMSTSLVFLTDGWHLMKFLMLVSLCCVPMFVNSFSYCYLFLYYILFSTGFTISFEFNKTMDFFRFIWGVATFKFKKFGVVWSIFFYLFLVSLIYGIINYL